VVAGPIRIPEVPTGEPSPNVTWHPSAADSALRMRCARQRGVTAWMTGLSGAGKSTVAAAAERMLLESGHLASVLDGDNLRHGLNAGLGFDAAGREEAVRRAGEAALLVAGCGVLAIVGMISPFRADRARVRARHREAGVPFLEVFVDADLATAEARDPKGLYARARRGEIAAFTGVSDPYEPPPAPEVHLRTGRTGAEDCARALADAILAASMRNP
jgi:bifunctional enzyme CysN/CysC